MKVGSVLRAVDFAAKRLYRTAQGFSPGFLRAANRPESGGRGASQGSPRVILLLRQTSGPPSGHLLLTT
jgi:hypothetical protein